MSRLTHRLVPLQAMSFNATTSVITLGLLPGVLWDQTQPATSLAYFRADGSGEGTLGYLLGKAVSGAGLRLIAQHVTSTTFGFVHGRGTSGSSTQPSITSPSMTYGLWYHAATVVPATMTGADCSMYISGGAGAGAAGGPLQLVTPSATTNGSGSLLSNVTDDLYIGNRSANDRTFNGSIGYVAQWNRLLSLSELRRAQADGPLAVRAGLIFCFANGRDYSPYAKSITGRTAVTHAGTAPMGFRLGRSRMLLDAAAAGGGTFTRLAGSRFALAGPGGLAA